LIAMAFIVALILFVVVVGVLDARLIRWPRPRPREEG
jgi:hypothetical protein